MGKYVNADTVKLDIRRYLMPNVDDDGTVTVENAERYFLNLLDNAPAADVVEVRHGEWNLEVHSFYMDTWDKSPELCVYILVSCSNCGEEHSPKEVFSMHVYAPEDADSDYRFDKEYEESKALDEFKKKCYKFQNYCPNCGTKMNTN